MWARVARLLTTAAVIGAVLFGTPGVASASSTDRWCTSISWWVVNIEKLCVPMP